MTSWNEGYVTDVDYTYGYYNELSPLRIRLAFADAGLKCPAIGEACELGFGQGLSANIHAAASTTSWHGNDFNPAQAAFAQELADASGAQANFVDESFEEFCGRTDLPDFDFIALHGIWSWISDANRSAIVDFIRRKLKVGGVLYISYNTLPGLGSFAPMRNLLTRHAEYYGVEGHGRVTKIEQAMQFADNLCAVNPTYLKANPQITEKLESLKGQNRNYLAHEYFNQDWHPMGFADMADWLKPAAMSFACSANFVDHVEIANLTPEQQAFLDTFTHPVFKQSVRDFLVNQQFRRDYWVKGPRLMNAAEKVEVIRGLRIVLTQQSSEIKLKAIGNLGEVALSEEIYSKVIGQLKDLEPRTIGEIEPLLKDSGITLGQLVQVVVMLAGTGALANAQDDCEIVSSKVQTAKLNEHLLAKARYSGDISCLASPVISAAVAVDRVRQLFLLAMKNASNTEEELAAFAWGVISSQGQKVILNGAPIDSEDENLKELIIRAEKFLRLDLPLYQALGLF